MILGFISLLLTFGQSYIIQICISEKAARTFLPCKDGPKMKGAESKGGTDGHGKPNVSSEGHRRRLLSQMIMDLTSNLRVLSGGGGDASCPPVSFFRQFFRSVRKVDYLSMRHGSVSVHIAPGSKFNFQKYIKRSLEDDFKVVVGISPTLWTSAVLFLLLNIGGWHMLLWISVMPMIIILAVGTKLQAIITKMALEIQERHAVVQGMPVVQLTNRHFWFGRPELVLFFIHFTLFQILSLLSRLR